MLNSCHTAGINFRIPGKMRNTEIFSDLKPICGLLYPSSNNQAIIFESATTRVAQRKRDQINSWFALQAQLLFWNNLSSEAAKTEKCCQFPFLWVLWAETTILEKSSIQQTDVVSLKKSFEINVVRD